MSFAQVFRLGSRLASSNLTKRSYSSNTTKEAFEAIKVEASAGAETWKKITLFVTIPLCLFFSVKSTRDEFEHIHHLEEHPETPVHYSYLDIHKKDLPWGDGQKPLFYNPIFDRNL
ncbi:hypothetical protein BB561_002191 [Smittium simulii]|uniref:Cytochrome c oxidase polypeptide VIa n=1 Tax=Smittium simulii TaxID=133385 RepID=A0A2T9YRB8_9FUNG|nr:hypothetical protein BB561_002191 [Smittium simulii]